MIDYLQIMGFLSHLCGEEGRGETIPFISTFLSHLCGEEASYTGSNFSGSLSKSPMR